MLSAKYTEQMPLLVLIYNYRLLFAFGENAFLFEFGENTLLFVFEKIRCCSYLEKIRCCSYLRKYVVVRCVTYVVMLLWVGTAEQPAVVRGGGEEQP